MLNDLRVHNAFIDDAHKYDYEGKILQELSAGNNLEVKKLLFSLHPADIADFIDKLTVEQRDILLAIIKNNFEPDLLLELEGSVKKYVIKVLGAKRTANILKNMEIDDLTHVLIDIDEITRDAILKALPKQTREEMIEQLAYPEDSIGRIMNKKFVSVPEHWTIGQAIDYLAKLKDLPEDFYEIFIVDPKFSPVGSLTLGKILNHARHVVIKDIMKPNSKMITPEISTEEVSYLFKQYGYVSLPVISKNKRIIGVVTIDDAMELIEKEAEEDIMLMGGVNDADFHSDIFKTFKSRFPWLFINLVTASLSAFVIASFEGTIAQIVALASIMPIVSSMGGNAGTQTMTLSLIAVTSKEISRLNISRIVIKQLAANILNGSAIALIGGLCVAFIQSDLQIGVIFAISVVINFTIAGFFGTMLPIVLKRMKIDPLVPSPILMTALTDMGGFLVFLGLATFFLL